MLSAVLSTLGGKSLVLQHRDELVEQNRRTLFAVNKQIASGVVNAKTKDFTRQATFAMVQTLAGDKNLERMRPVDVLTIDEAHHTAANSYQKIIEKARELNPDVKLLGVTATPNRGDKKALKRTFDNCADQITLGELIAVGNLVRPRTFVVDLGVQEELSHVKRNINDFDMAEVEKILNKRVLNEKVVEAWKEKAGDRQTVVFCSTVAHASDVVSAFRSAGVSAEIVTGDMADGDRKRALKAFDQGEIQVIVNVMVLTEGWDCQPVGCIVLLRPSSFKSTMIQMIGRGLRRVDPERYPGRVKTDCIVLDFGTSILTHGSLEQEVDLDPHKGEAPKKTCPDCDSTIPNVAKECPICGHVFLEEDEEIGGSGGGTASDGEGIENFILTEIDLFNQSPYRWVDLWNDESALIATAFEAWAVAMFFGNEWHAIGGSKIHGVSHLARGDKMLSLAAADDYLRTHGDTKGAAKTKTWLHLPATPAQLKYLPHFAALPAERRPTRYEAGCHLTWKFSEHSIQKKLSQIGLLRAA